MASSAATMAVLAIDQKAKRYGIQSPMMAKLMAVIANPIAIEKAARLMSIDPP